jgi:hypothetical protein
MGEACGTRDGEFYASLWENLNERDHFEDLCVISGFRREVDENRALPGYYVASNGNSLPTFRDNRRSLFQGSVDYTPLKIGPIICPETSVKNYHYSLRKCPEERDTCLGGVLNLIV